MSQAGIINIAGGGGGGAPIQTLTGDSGGPVSPTANNINVIGGSSTVNNPLGFTVIGTPATSTETFTLTNRFHNSATTIGATTADIITFALGATPGCFFFNFGVSVFNASTPAGAGYETYTTVRTDGATATIIGDTDSITHEDAALITTIAQVVVSGNNVIFRVTGVAGLTIDWQLVGNYIEAT